jgi:hypothetical protein
MTLLFIIGAAIVVVAVVGFLAAIGKANFDL